MLKTGLHEEIFPVIEEVMEILHDLAENWKDIPMLAKTHGQPASLLVWAKKSMYSWLV